MSFTRLWLVFSAAGCLANPPTPNPCQGLVLLGRSLAQAESLNNIRPRIDYFLRALRDFHPVTIRTPEQRREVEDKYIALVTSSSQFEAFLAQRGMTRSTERRALHEQVALFLDHQLLTMAQMAGRVRNDTLNEQFPLRGYSGNVLGEQG